MVMESIRKKFIEGPLLKQKIAEYVDNFLSRSWIANVDIQYSPLSTKIYLYVVNPRDLLGRRSRKINELSEKLKNDLKIENPQINVVEVKNPMLEPKIIAKKAALGIMRGKKVRAVLFRLANQVIQNGAMGIEIIADGKLGAKGARSRKIKVYYGFVPKAGDPANKVKKAHFRAVTKYGIIGITVRIATEDLYAPFKKNKEKSNEEENKENKSESKEKEVGRNGKN